MAEVNPTRADFEGYWNLDEASGNAIDASPNGHDLTETSGTIASADGGRDFEAGDTEYFTKADHADLSFGDEAFTVGCWVKLEAQTANRTFIGKYDHPNNDREYSLRYEYTGDRYEFLVSSDGTLGNSTTVNADTYGAVPATTIAFVIAWHDPDTDKIYISVNNGVADEAAHAGGCNDNISPFRLGAYGGTTPSGYMDGILWSAFVARKIYTADEREWLYNSGTPRKWGELAPPGVLKINGVLWENCKTVNGIAQADVKSVQGFA